MAMRVLIVNTSEREGGAAVAANRLMDALNNNGVKAKMLVRDKETDDITVVGLKSGLRQRFNFLWERWCVYWHLHFKRDHLFELDLANTGSDITKLPEFKEADVIHLAWINQGFLSLNVIRKIINSGKAIVWTMHDLWPATGICHFTLGCEAYKGQCRKCFFLPGGGSATDLSTRVFNKKKKLYYNSGIHFVACSKWLGSSAKQSSLLTGLQLSVIPNPIDTHVFCPKDKRAARLHSTLPEDKRIILFVSQRVTMERKGMAYFIKAISLLAERHPEMKENTAIAILGGRADEVVSQLALPSFPLGYIRNERQLVDIYNSADVFVIPSLDDNLPNTIMEAMACGVPSVGFKVGGIPEMIDHQKNGYVANFKDADDLAAGIHWVLDEADNEDLKKRCVQKVMSCYSQRSVAMKYVEVYNQALAFKNYKL
jgi:glycosyltransferase involved in cell wall biosynthesis